MFVIIKKSRQYLGGIGYIGSTCQKANVTPGKIYEDETGADTDAAKMSAFNPVGFRVERYKDRKMSYVNADLGVVDGIAIKLDVEYGLRDHCTLKEFMEYLDSFEYEVVDLTDYRPPAFSWKNGIGTLVMAINPKPESLLNFGTFLLRCQPDEYDFLTTEEGDIFVRVWWD